MQKIPMPVVVGLVVVALAALGFAIYSSVNHPAGDTGNIQSITKEIEKQNPKDAPDMPESQKPANTAMPMGKKGAAR